MHFAEEAFESKNRLVKGAIPTEFWVEILESFVDEADYDDTREIGVDIQMKYNELKQLNLENQMDFNIREASLQKKNNDLERTIQKQVEEISALKKSLAASQTLNENLKTKLIEAKTSTNIKVSIHGCHYCWHSHKQKWS